MRVRNLVIAGLLAPLATLTAQSGAAHGSDLSIGLRWGTLGIGGEISKLVTPHLGLRAGANFFSLNRTFDQNDITYDAKLKMKAVTLLADLYPGRRGSFHLTGGLITKPLEVVGTGQPAAGGTYDINKHTYTSSQVGTLTASGKWPATSPYLGLGFGTPAASHAGLKFVFDLGIAASKPTIALTATGAASNPQLQSDLNAQIAKTQADVNKYAKVYPVLSFGLVMRF